MVWDRDEDMKEYRPRRKQRTDAVRYLIPAPDTAYTQEESGVSGGIDMTTSEILDFAEGADSF